MSDIARDAATGAALGSVIPGPGTIVGGAIGAAVGVLQSTGLFATLGTKLFGTGGSIVAQKVVAAATAVAGGTSPQQLAGLTPDQQLQLRVQITQIAAQQQEAEWQSDLASLQAAFADTDSARKQTQALVADHSSIAWGAPAVSVVVLLSFLVVLVLMLTLPLPQNSETILSLVIGSLSSMATAVVSYWVGSSSGSASKNALLANSVPISSLEGHPNLKQNQPAQEETKAPGPITFPDAFTSLFKRK